MVYINHKISGVSQIIPLFQHSGFIIMSFESPLTKRIKRHVIGRKREYFAATAPGLERLCLSELQSLSLENFTASAVTGGVSFKGRLQDCYLANLNLRTANRILMRIETIHASSFSQLQTKLSDISWELFLSTDQVPQIHVTTRHCKLYHTGAISERILKAIAARKHKFEFIAPGQKFPSPPQNVYVRGVDDRFTVSIDSSGENLYRRGIKKHAGTAPLRETAAAAALMIAGYTGSEPLIDPMCGTGTFALEAALMAKNIPPGWFRDFAFMGWPSFQKKRWEHLKHETESIIVSPKTIRILASDEDTIACGLLDQCLKQFNLDDTVSVSNTDFFTIERQQVPGHRGFVAINPPYGRRIGTKPESEKLFSMICTKLQESFKGWQLILFAPGKGMAKNVPFRLKKYPFWHGGLKLKLMIGMIN
jgi:putative N6-adenine-specific DNA methylase